MIHSPDNNLNSEMVINSNGNGEWTFKACEDNQLCSPIDKTEFS